MLPGTPTMAEALPPYDVVHMLNRFFGGASDVITANGGRVDNYMGDAVLALFGVDHETMPAVAAIRSGLGVLEVAADVNHYVERIYGRTFAVRIGIDFGEVVFGLLGSDDTARETAIGDPVNVASASAGSQQGSGYDHAGFRGRLLRLRPRRGIRP